MFTKAIVLTIESKHEMKFDKLEERIKELEAENNALKYNKNNFSDNENYTEYDKLNREYEL